MDCQFCKNSRTLKYVDTAEVRLPFERKPRNVQIVEKVITHVFCIYKREVVFCVRDEKKYCEHERGIFDDYPDYD